MPAQDLARDDAAYDLISQNDDISTYRVGPFDRLTITVFDEPSLSFADIPVDAEGRFDYPLIGSVDAAGLTTEQLTAEIKGRLDSTYYRDARVTVFVTNSASRYVVVEGSVEEPGRYELTNGRASLVEVIALAKSPTRTAKLDQVMVFRMENGERYGAVFNLADIRNGKADDPILRGGDVVVVNFSFLKGAFRDFLTTAPFFNVFTRF
ncbi:MAG: polysaccharide biosynthesis/export family protein [Erythrobacter sp.]